MRVTVKFFAYLREITSHRFLEREIAEGSTVDRLISSLAVEFPRFPAHSPALIVSVNQEFAGRDRVLQDGDEVALFPPVSGGREYVQSH
jgi:molybdopterin converting factor subunit 1